MALNFRRINTGIQIIPKVTSNVDTAGELDFDTTNHKLNLHNGTISSPVVTEAGGSTLTNKVISGGTISSSTISVSSNTISSTANRIPQFNSSTGSLESSNVTNTELSYLSGATSNIQTQINAIVVAGGANVNLSNLASVAINTSLLPASDNTINLGNISKRWATLYTESLNDNNGPSGTLAVSVINRTLNDIFGATNIDFSGATGNVLIKNITVANDTITGSTSSDLTITTQNNRNLILTANGTGQVTVSNRLRVSSNIQYDLITNSSTTGASAFISSITQAFTRLTNASLTSIGGLVIGLEGQSVTLTNVTGATININNEDTGLTAANRILTGTGNNLSVPNNSSVQLLYDTVTNRWRVIGSAGGMPGSNWSSSLTFTPSIGFGTITSSEIFSRRVGDSMQVRGTFVAGTTGGGIASIAIPNGYELDRTKMSTNTCGTQIGNAIGISSASLVINTSGREARVFYDGFDNANIYFTQVTNSGAMTKVAANGFAQSSEPVSFYFEYPVFNFAF